MSDDEEEGGRGNRKLRTRFSEFDCPECYANNPMDDGFKIGDVVRCFYCGLSFKVNPNENEKYTLKLQ